MFVVEKKRDCILILSQKKDEKTLDLLETLIKSFEDTHDIFLILHSDAREFVELDKFSILKLSSEEIFRPVYLEKIKRRVITPGNTDLFLLEFWRLYSNYQFYWFIEFDVWMRGGAEELARIDQASSADLLSSFLWTKATNPGWFHWSSLIIGQEPREGLETEEAKFRGTFHSLARFSAQLIQRIDWCYTHGWGGHHEVVWASVASFSGLKIDDINSVSKKLGYGNQYDWVSYNTKEAKSQWKMKIFHPIKNMRRQKFIHQEMIVRKLV